MEGLDRITFFRSYFDAEKQMHSQKDKLSFLEAILCYAFEEEGDLPAMTPAAALAFSLVRPHLDASRNRAYGGRAGGQKRQALAREKASREQAEAMSDPGTEQAPAKPEESPGQAETKPASSNKNMNRNEEEKKKEEKRKPAPPLLAFGEYKWIKLTQEQYDRLLADLGKTELERCIQVVDEAVQKNGNRYGYKDWNLVLRKAHREGWGQQERRTANYGSGGISVRPAKAEHDGSIQYD